MSDGCPACKAVRRYSKNPPPCETCRVGILPENAEAAMVFSYCRSQVITAGEGNQVIGLNFPSVFMFMDRFKIRDQKRTFEKVVKAFNWLNFNKGEAPE